MLFFAVAPENAASAAFTRGWTAQELHPPAELSGFSKSGKLAKRDGKNGGGRVVSQPNAINSKNSDEGRDGGILCARFLAGPTDSCLVGGSLVLRACQ